MVKCADCGVGNTELHAHHIESFKDCLEKRDSLDNGLTLCWKCHYKLHAAAKANGVNSGKLLPSNVGDNPEPSLDGNIFEGVTTNGRAYRRWIGNCTHCGDLIHRRVSSIHSERVFCNKSCKASWQHQNTGFTQSRRR